MQIFEIIKNVFTFFKNVYLEIRVNGQFFVQIAPVTKIGQILYQNSPDRSSESIAEVYFGSRSLQQKCIPRSNQKKLLKDQTLEAPENSSNQEQAATDLSSDTMKELINVNSTQPKKNLLANNLSQKKNNGDRRKVALKCEKCIRDNEKSTMLNLIKVR